MDDDDIPEMAPRKRRTLEANTSSPRSTLSFVWDDSDIVDPRQPTEEEATASSLVQWTDPQQALCHNICKRAVQLGDQNLVDMVRQLCASTLPAATTPPQEVQPPLGGTNTTAYHANSAGSVDLPEDVSPTSSAVSVSLPENFSQQFFSNNDGTSFIDGTASLGTFGDGLFHQDGMGEDLLEMSANSGSNQTDSSSSLFEPAATASAFHPPVKVHPPTQNACVPPVALVTPRDTQEEQKKPNPVTPTRNNGQSNKITSPASKKPVVLPQAFFYPHPNGPMDPSLDQPLFPYDGPDHFIQKNDRDVPFGRGGSHHGQGLKNQLLNDSRDHDLCLTYRSLKNCDKNGMLVDIRRQVHQLGGRFIELNRETEKWELVKDVDRINEKIRNILNSPYDAIKGLKKRSKKKQEEGQDKMDVPCNIPVDELTL